MMEEANRCLTLCEILERLTAWRQFYGNSLVPCGFSWPHASRAFHDRLGFPPHEETVDNMIQCIEDAIGTEFQSYSKPLHVTKNTLAVVEKYGHDHRQYVEITDSVLANIMGDTPKYFDLWKPETVVEEKVTETHKVGDLVMWWNKAGWVPIIAEDGHIKSKDRCRSLTDEELTNYFGVKRVNSVQTTNTGDTLGRRNAQ